MLFSVGDNVGCWLCVVFIRFCRLVSVLVSCFVSVLVCCEVCLMIVVVLDCSSGRLVVSGGSRVCVKFGVCGLYWCG